MVIGAAVLPRLTRRLDTALTAGTRAGVLRERLRVVALANLLVLVSAVYAMVVKPTL